MVYFVFKKLNTFWFLIPTFWFFYVRPLLTPYVIKYRKTGIVVLQETTKLDSGILNYD